MTQQLEKWRDARNRDEAVQEGALINLAGKFPKEVFPNYHIPVYCTARVWHKILWGASSYSRDLDAEVRNVIYMSRCEQIQSDRTDFLFQVGIPFEEPCWICSPLHFLRTVIKMDKVSLGAVVFILMADELMDEEETC